MGDLPAATNRPWALVSVLREAVLLLSVPYAESIFSEVLQSSVAGDEGLCGLGDELLTTIMGPRGEVRGVGSLALFARVLGGLDCGGGGAGGFLLTCLKDLDGFRFVFGFIVTNISPVAAAAVSFSST